MKVLSIFSALVISLGLISSYAHAAPIALQIEIQCPVVKGNVNSLANFGDYIAGYGKEFIQLNGAKEIYFKSEALPQNIPQALNTYQISDTQYDSTQGKILCNYVSSVANEPGFSVAYVLTNGKGGQVIQAGADKIVLSLPVGLS